MLDNLKNALNALLGRYTSYEARLEDEYFKLKDLKDSFAVDLALAQQKLAEAENEIKALTQFAKAKIDSDFQVFEHKLLGEQEQPAAEPKGPGAPTGESDPLTATEVLPVAESSGALPPESVSGSNLLQTPEDDPSRQ